MSFLSFLTPLYYGYQAYLSTSIDLPIDEINDSGTIVRLQKGAPRYNEAIKQLTGHTIKEELQPFFEKVGVREDLIVLEDLGRGLCVGTNFFTKGDAAIIVGRGFNETDKDACHFVIKHEVSHLKYNDNFTTCFVPAVCATAAAIFTTFARKPLPRITSVMATAAIGILSHTAFSRYREGKADDFAIAESSNEELKGRRRYLLGLLAFHKEYQKTFWKKIIISSSGENRLDIEHPSLKSRLKKVEDELVHRKVIMDACEESEKMDRLKNFISNIQSQIEKELEKTKTVR